MQQKRSRAKEKGRLEREKVAREGPGCLGREGQSSQTLKEDQLPEFQDFWKGVWETEGQYNPHHKAVKGWVCEVEKETSKSEDDDVPEKDQI